MTADINRIAAKTRRTPNHTSRVLLWSSIASVSLSWLMVGCSSRPLPADRSKTPEVKSVAVTRTSADAPRAATASRAQPAQSRVSSQAVKSVTVPYMSPEAERAATAARAQPAGGRLTPASGSPVKVESLFAGALVPETTRLQTARRAAAQGQRELAIHDYVISITEDSSTAAVAIEEMVKCYLAGADAYAAHKRYIDEGAWIRRCYQTLQGLVRMDAGTRALPQPARTALFKEIERVRASGRARAANHLTAAGALCRDAESFWGDDEDMQEQALHRVNLAWQYHPEFTEPRMLEKLYEIHADMKSELSSRQYKRAMERDRLQLGRVVEARD